MTDKDNKLTNFLKSSGLISDKNKKPENKNFHQKKTVNKNHHFAKKNYDRHEGRLTVSKKIEKHPTNKLIKQKSGNIRVVPLGGMEQVGMNMMFLEWDDDIIIIDTGIGFPDAEHFGIDCVIPDTTYLEKNKHKIRGIIYTHGHLDHIGAASKIIPKLGYPPILTSRLTKELILVNTENSEIAKKYKFNDINPESKIKLGKFLIEFFHVNHTIAENLGVAINTPYGLIINTSDFKIDHNPADDQPADLGKIASFGQKGVVLAMSDSTGIMKAGHTPSESNIIKEMDDIISQHEGRLIITTFASNVGRIAKIIESGEKNGRTVFIAGRSMEKNVSVIHKLNYLKCREKTIQKISTKVDSMPPNKVLILATGSQGEQFAAITRMAKGKHAQVKLNQNDSILYSSSPIIGNEPNVVKVWNKLSEIGVRVMDKSEFDVYVSGHGHREELKLMLSLLNPKFFAPIHGEVFMRSEHNKVANNDLGIPEKNCFLMRDGLGVIVNENGVRLMTDQEKINIKHPMIEFEEKVNDKVIFERGKMSESGSVFVVIEKNKNLAKNIEIKFGGVHFGKEKKMLDVLKNEAKKVFENNIQKESAKHNLNNLIENSIQKFFREKFRKEPVVSVIII